MLALDGDGAIVAANHAAIEMLDLSPPWPPVSNVLALPVAALFDAARRRRPPWEVPTWGGLRVLALVQQADDAPAAPTASAALPLRSREAALIRQAVAEAGSNVDEAARRLGIGRATIDCRLRER